jgi:uncharacterized caspase-like protein
LARFSAFFLAAGILSVGISVPPAAAEKRVALVIGNGAYQNTLPLANPANDAADIAVALERLGFEVQVERDLTKRGMEAALSRFARSVENADAALFFYAGHGVQFRHTNYLVPVDARLEDDVSINYELLRLDDILFSLERAKGVKLLLLDACRNNPLVERLVRRGDARDASLTRGLARVEGARGMVIAYATQADEVAVDGAGRNSPFTGALVKYLAEPGLEVVTLLRRVAIEVDRATGGKQLPETWVTLRNEFYLNSRDSDARQQLEAATLREQRARIERERAEMEQAERVAQERAERERVAREAAAREQRVRAEQEQALREQAARDRTTQEAAQVAAQTAAQEAIRKMAEEAAKQAAREQAERQSRQTPNTQIAMVPPPASPAPDALSGGALVRGIKTELKRTGCLAGAVDEQWSTSQTKSSIAKFVRFAGLPNAPDQPSMDFLDAIKRSGPRVCPAECGVRQVERNGYCVAKVCPRDKVLSRDGNCEERAPKRKIAARTPPSQPAPPSEGRAPRPVAGGAAQAAVVCFNRGCRTGVWSPTPTPGARCRHVFGNRNQFFCN